MRPDGEMVPPSLAGGGLTQALRTIRALLRRPFAAFVAHLDRAFHLFQCSHPLCFALVLALLTESAP